MWEKQVRFLDIKQNSQVKMDFKEKETICISFNKNFGIMGGGDCRFSITDFDFPSNRTNVRLWWVVKFNAKRTTVTSLIRGSEGGINELWAKITSPRSFLQTVVAMENEFLMVTSKLILTQTRGGGIHLVDMEDLRVV